MKWRAFFLNREACVYAHVCTYKCVYESVHVSVCVCLWYWGGGVGDQSGIWLTVCLQLHTWAPQPPTHLMYTQTRTCTHTNTATYMNTHRGQTLLSYVIGCALAVVFSPLKHLYELTYRHHKGLIVCV